ncbi:MAG: 4-hydroxy-tetrahydrodipicolinate synthase [Lachnospiraceae bacterium]
MSIFTGSGTAIITPMNADGSVNYDSFGEMIEFQIANGTDCIVVCGTTGEASTLTHEEHIETIRYCVDKVAKRIPVIAGTGSNCTETAIYLSKEAEKCGADGILVVTPYYNKATQNGLFAHFSAIAAAVNIPVVLYNIPGRTGCKMTPETIARLYREVENIVAVKEASGDMSAVAKIVSLTNGEMDIYSGNDDQVLPILSLGGKGVISVLSNIAPRETHEMVASFLAGDVKKAQEIQLKYIPLISALFCEVNPIPVKKALNLMGMNAGPLRMPLTEMEEQNAERLAAEMSAVGLIK